MLKERKLPEHLHGARTPVKDIEDALSLNYYLFALTYSSFFKHIVNAYGEEGRKLAAKATEEIGLKWGQAMLDIAEMDSTDKTAAAAGESYSRSLRYFGFDNDLIEASEKRAVVRMRKCPLLEYWRWQFPEIIPHVCYVEPFIDVGSYRFINPHMNLDITCKMSEGAPYCDYVITMEDPDKKGPELYERGAELFKKTYGKKKG